ncbi:hypothetical protein GQ53DRAFT_842000 [Thozetella sp. PMI_491]|nr:hypothetical protein GQ53DRAFT_842000 [Thozetella sp. PMI_491]
MPRPPKVARAKRDARGKRAKAIINTTIPALLKANPRARRGIDGAELVSDPPLTDAPPPKGPIAAGSPDGNSSSSTRVADTAPSVGKGDDSWQPNITIRLATTLSAAAALVGGRGHRVGILNMASPLRPGGGVLTGATSQEEWLCSRTTLYPSLRDEWYRLPEVGGVYTPDVLVFGRWDADVGELLDKRDQFYVDVVTAAMLRFPDVVQPEGEDAPAERRYAEDKDRELVLRKMRAVLRMFRVKGVSRVVLGAWGCGAYGSPVGEVARAWKKVLLGGRPKRKKRGGDGGTGAEAWDGLEVVFAIKDRAMATEFARVFGSELLVEDGDATGGLEEGGSGTDEGEDETEESA